MEPTASHVLVQRARQRDSAAIAVLFDRYRDKLRLALRRKLGLEPFAIVPLEYLPNRKGDGYHFVPLFDSRVARGGSCDMLRSVTYAARRMKYGASSRHLVVGVRPVRAVAK